MNNFVNDDFNFFLKIKDPNSVTLKENKLVKKCFFGRLFHRGGLDSKKQELINSKIKAINRKLCDFLKNSKPTAEEAKKINRYLDAIRLFPKKWFDRKEFVFNPSYENLKFFINPDLKLLKKEKELLKKKENSKNDLNLNLKIEKHIILRKIAKNKLAMRLGGGITINKGTSETKLLYRYKKDGSELLVGVFKPRISQMSFFRRFLNWIIILLGDQKSLLSQKSQAGSEAEVSSYYIDRFFGFNIVPPSIKTKYGVFQLCAKTFLKHLENSTSKAEEINIKEAKDSKDILNKATYTEKELELFQFYAIHDYLIGDLDGHDENWFIRFNKDKKICGIVGIDKANSFLRKNPKTNSRSGKKQYLWRKKAIAAKPFTEKAVQLMKSMTREKVEESIAFLDTKVPGFLDDEMKKQYRLRAEVLHKFGLNHGRKIYPSSPKSLAAIRTNEALQFYHSKKRK